MFLSAATFHPGTQIASAAVTNPPVVEATSAISLAIPEVQVNVLPKEPIITTEQYIKNYYSKNPILAKISKCESEYRQFTTNGNVLRGRAVAQDVGAMQINETYHLTEAKNLGYDIYTLDGNLAFGQYLFDHQGTAPWSASAPCWDK